MSTSLQPSAPRIASFKIIAGAVMAAVVIMVGVVITIVPSPTTGQVYLGPLIVVVVGAGAAALAQLMGYQAPAIPAGTPPTEAQRAALTAWSAGFFRRFALCEMPAMVGIALAFAFPNGPLTCLVGGAIALALAGWHLWPSERVIDRVRQVLERDGAQSQLREALGLRPY